VPDMDPFDFFAVVDRVHDAVQRVSHDARKSAVRPLSLMLQQDVPLRLS
jgi:hypothetical protein